MKLFKSLFDKKEVEITNYDEFWFWFEKNAAAFHAIVKKGNQIEPNFFNPLSSKLEQLKKDTFWYLVGMKDEETAELILTADGNLLNIAFVEDLVAKCPNVPNWKVTCLKQPSESVMSIEMEGLKFNEETLKFYATEHRNEPDLIDITITYRDYSPEKEAIITNGIYLLLENYIGELNTATNIDRLQIKALSEANQELIPFYKLKDFLLWRQKEFIEKYKGIRHHTEEDNYAGLEGTLKNNLPLIALVNTDVLKWDSKASHPWIAILIIKFNGEKTNGMPNPDLFDQLSTIEEKVSSVLKDFDGYINIGRETANGTRELYFACQDFRKPSKVFYDIQKEYIKNVKIEFEIYKDKYWQTFNKYI